MPLVFQELGLYVVFVLDSELEELELEELEEFVILVESDIDFNQLSADAAPVLELSLLLLLSLLFEFELELELELELEFELEFEFEQLLVFVFVLKEGHIGQTGGTICVFKIYISPLLIGIWLPGIP